MKLSTDRILTTHVGSLPRSDAVSEQLLAREDGRLESEARFESVIGAAVNEVVARQVKSRVDVVSDGEMGKIGYATYIKDRLTGFEGDSARRVPGDIERFPDYIKMMSASGQTPKIKRPRCVGPIEIKDRKPLERDLANFRRAVDASKAVDAFMPAASPGVISVFQPNEYYKNDEAYLERLSEVMGEEYEAIVKAGFVVQIDCPDLAMGRHILYKNESDDQFVRHAEVQIEALNHALRNVPANMARLHLCWGNYEGPHICDIPLAKIIKTVLKAKPQAISFEAANPRHAHEWTVFKDVKLPDDKVLLPGVIDSCSNYIEHPELVAERLYRFADIVGRERVIASSDCGFGTFVGFGKIFPEFAYMKLEAMAEGAEIASKRLWGRR
ncbi:MAG: epoxyalkane--coenzyme M transferase [Alphaproteobacteria bacterium]|nr:epoxyalkane--coenzyme M transferase [Alphaproteobacteria bacterium]